MEDPAGGAANRGPSRNARGVEPARLDCVALSANPSTARLIQDIGRPRPRKAVPPLFKP